MELVTLAPLALGAIPWRDGAGALQLTVVAKATFELRHREPARLIEPYALFEDLHYEENEGRSLRVASDHAPRKANVDVLVTGAVYSPVGERVQRRTVRFAIVAGHTRLIDKQILAIGWRERDESGAVGTAAPFAYLPLRYELAYGGATSRSNPIGVGADAVDPRQPSLVHPDNPQLVAGLGPVPPSWWWRTRALGGAEPPVFGQGVPTLPASLDFAYFNAAPPDQQIPRLLGDETVLMTGLHPTMSEVSLPLPGRRAHAVLDLQGVRRDVPLVLDTLWIDGDTNRCTLTWRGAMRVDGAGVEALAAARVIATLAREGEAPTWERRAEVDLSTTRRPRAVTASVEPPPVGAPKAGVDLGPSSLGRTLSIDLEIDRPPPVAPKSTTKPKPPPRVTPHVPVVTDTGLQVWTAPWQVKPPDHTLTLLVKGTFTLGAGATPSLASEQDPPSGDVPYDDDPSGQGASLRYASDFAIFKPAADVLLVGHAYPRDPRSGVAMVELRVGHLRRRIAVFGDRTWGTEDKPASFEKMPLRWERALGGSLSEANPVGRGYKTGLLLPNLERPEALVGSKSDRPEPACFAPVSPSWRPRHSKLGTYDANWQKARWPYLPADFDWSHFNAAPPEQQVPYLQGAERFSISGARPSGVTIAGRLPDLRPRAFAQRTEEAGGDFFEVLLRLDTASFDLDAGKLHLVWRGLFAVDDEDAPEIAAVFVDRDPPGAPLSLDHAQDRFFARWAASQVAPVEVLAFPDDPPRVTSGPRAPAPPQPPTAQQVLARLASAGTLATSDLTGARLAGADLSGADLSRAILARADLSGAKLDRARLAGAVLTGVAAEGASFVGADLTEADMTGADLTRATFGGATVSHAVFDDAKAGGSSFVEVRGDGASFVGASLVGATLDRASLAAANLSAATLDGATFRAAKLDDVRLYDAHGERVVFERASMAGARAEKVVLPKANLLGIAASGSSWESGDLRGATMQEAQLDGAIFTRARLDGATLNKATAVGASFRRASLAGARCLRANLMRAVFERADLTDADLRGANLYQAETWRAKTLRVDLSLAHVAGTKLAT
jgi:uncharacterized protein YjbI with pentapeptide repeats